MAYASIHSFFIGAVCSAAAKRPPAGCEGLCTTSPPIAPATWELNPFSAMLAERHCADERCQVWVANLLLTFSAVAVVLLRTWWACGNLPPSDSRYEPALGRVIQPPTQPDVGVADERGPVSPSASLSTTSHPSQSRLQGPLCPPFTECGPTPLNATASSPPPSSVSNFFYLPVGTTPAAVASSRPVLEGEDENEATSPPHSPTPPARGAWLAKLGHAASARGATHALAAWQRRVTGHLLTFLYGCTTAWKPLLMLFSAAPAFSLSLRRCGPRSPTKGSWRCCHAHRRHSPRATEGRRTQTQPDMSAQDAEDRLAAQEELWGILEGIERRRRALTSRSLFRYPLPSYSQRRLCRRRVSLSLADQPQRGVPLASAVSTAGEVIPTLALGVPLDFSTDRKERPVLVDRRGRWIPVAVVDEDRERYNYNMDQVVLQD